MIAQAELFASKNARQENFPVASWVIQRRYRAAIMGFYRFAREADDVADNSNLSASDKLRILGATREALEGKADAPVPAARLGQILRDFAISPVYAHELIDAFQTDAVVSRYRTWKDLLGYCRLSAAPVGRFMLELHGEDRQTWPFADALCTALQINNHLQDCRRDFLALDRVYIPLDMLEAEGAALGDLTRKSASPALGRVLVTMARKSMALLAESRPLARMIADPRLAIEVSVIQELAERLALRLVSEDPLAKRVRIGWFRSTGIAGRAVLRSVLAGR